MAQGLMRSSFSRREEEGEGTIFDLIVEENFPFQLEI
jgi:hypothetical protein